VKVQEIYERVTNKIITDIEAGNLPPWLLPWKRGIRTGIVPVNAATGSHYNGLNVLTLWCQREEKEWPTPYWCTYKQCQAMGGHVRKGEKSAPIIYVSKTAVKDKDTAEERLIPFLKSYWVFNVAQCDGLPHNEPEPELPEHERNAAAEAFLSAPGGDPLGRGNGGIHPFQGLHHPATTRRVSRTGEPLRHVGA